MSRKSYKSFTSSKRDLLYRKAIERSEYRIQRCQEKVRCDPLGSRGPYFEQYERAKWNYALIFHRYEQARKEKEWVY